MVSPTVDWTHVAGNSSEAAPGQLGSSVFSHSSHHSAVSRPEHAAARTDWRKRLRSAGALPSRSRAALTRARSCSTFATIRFCSARGAIGIRDGLMISSVSLVIALPVIWSVIALKPTGLFKYHLRKRASRISRCGFRRATLESILNSSSRSFTVAMPVVAPSLM